VLKSSHAFNVLDARGAMSTTERAKWFATMRAQSRAVAELWTELRASADHPRGTHTPLPLASAPDPVDDVAEGLLVFEILVEELPPHVVEAVQARSNRLCPSSSRTPHCPMGECMSPLHRDASCSESKTLPNERATESTSSVGQRWLRRLPRTERRHRHSSVSAGAICRRCRSESRRLQRTEHVALDVPKPGRLATAVLTELLSKLVAGLRSDKNMRGTTPS